MCGFPFFSPLYNFLLWKRPGLSLVFRPLCHIISFMHKPSPALILAEVSLLPLLLWKTAAELHAWMIRTEIGLFPNLFVDALCPSLGTGAFLCPRLFLFEVYLGCVPVSTQCKSRAAVQGSGLGVYLALLQPGPQGCLSARGCRASAVHLWGKFNPNWGTPKPLGRLAARTNLITVGTERKLVSKTPPEPGEGLLWMCLGASCFSSHPCSHLLQPVWRLWIDLFGVDELKCHAPFWMEKIGKLSRIHSGTSINH